MIVLELIPFCILIRTIFPLHYEWMVIIVGVSLIVTIIYIEVRSKMKKMKEKELEIEFLFLQNEMDQIKEEMRRKGYAFPPEMQE